MLYKVITTPEADMHLRMLERSQPAAFRKVQKLMHELEEHPCTGTGKPEQLRGSRSGQWSRRITDKHRLVYVIDDDKIIVLVLAAAGHYY